MGRSYALFAVLLVTTLAGCKIQVTAPYEGAVASADMEFVCLPESVCEIEVADFEMDMKLHAVSRPGYRFVAWADGEKHLCPGFTEQICRIRTDNLDPDDPELQALMATDHMFYLEPVFEREAHPPGAEDLFLDSLLFD